MSTALKIYRRMARAFPHEFKLAYGTEVMQAGDDMVDEVARRHGMAGILPLLGDVAMRVPLEYMSEIRRDLRYALRALRKSPGFALVGILSLGLSMGITTSMFSTLWVQLFRDLPGATNASELLMSQEPVSYPYIEQYREQKSLVAGVAAFANGIPFNVTFQGDAEGKQQRIFGQLVSPDYFSVLGVQAQRGRTLSPALDQHDAAVVVISDRFWRNRMNSSPDAVGQTLHLNGQPATIVGIGPKDFNGAAPVVPGDLFVPITAPAAMAPELGNDVLHNRDAKQFLALVRTAHGVSADAAETGLDTVTRGLDQQVASSLTAVDKSRRIHLLTGGKNVPIPRELKPVVVAFYSILIGLIMAMACMNLANMLLARGAARRKELAIRLSIGASRFRLIRQMLTEGVLLALLGAAGGFGLAYWLSVLSSQIHLPSAVPQEFDRSVDWHAALFTFALAVVVGVGFSLVPALQATKTDFTPALKEGAAETLPSHRRFGIRNLLMVAQVAGSLMLLLITGFLVMGIGKASLVHTNFDPRTMYTLSIDPVREGYTGEKAQALFEKLPEKLRGVSAVESVTLADQPPFSIPSAVKQLTAEKNGGKSPRVLKQAAIEKIGAGYFAMLNQPMLAGREFTEQDQRSPGDASATLPAVLNEKAARGLFGNGNAVGERLREDKQTYEVVGVVRDQKMGLADEQFGSVMYPPLTRRDFARPGAGGMTIIIRSSAGPDALGGVRKEIAAIDPKLTIFNVETLSEHLENSRAFMVLALDIYGGIGLFGLILAAIGLAGVTAYAVARRRKEIGIRMALGASKAQVLRLVLKEGTALVAIGSVLGFLAAVGLAKVLKALTSAFVEALNVGTTDLRLLLGAPLLLAALAMLACYLPARRAAKIDPLKALRES